MARIGVAIASGCKTQSIQITPGVSFGKDQRALPTSVGHSTQENLFSEDFFNRPESTWIRLSSYPLFTC